MYVNYPYLKKLLSPFKLIKKLYINTSLETEEGESDRRSLGKNDLIVTSMKNDDVQKVFNFRKVLENAIVEECKKIYMFVQYKLADLNRM